MKNLTYLLITTCFLFYSNSKSYAQNFGLGFDGTNDYVDISSYSNMSPTNAVTIEAWIKGNSSDNTSTKFIYDRIETNDGYGLTVTSSGSARLTINGGDAAVTSSINVLDGNWNHIAGTYDQITGALHVYVNGSLDGSFTYSSPIDYSTEPRNGIGGPGASTNFFKGEISEVRVWNYARSLSEIQNNRCVALDVTLHPGLIAYWLLDEGTGSITGDATSNGNNGVLLNGVTWQSGAFTCECTMPTIKYVSDVINGRKSVAGAMTYVHTFVEPTGLIGGGVGPEFTVQVSIDSTFSDTSLIRTRSGDSLVNLGFRYLCPQTNYFARAKVSSESADCYGPTVKFNAGNRSATNGNNIRNYNASGVFTYSTLSPSIEPTISLDFSSNPTLQNQVGIRVSPQGAATKYRVQISTNENFSPFVPSSSESNPTSTNTWGNHWFTLEEGKKYYVRATYEGQGVGNAGLPLEIPTGETCSLPNPNNLWGRTVTFVTAGAPASLQTPELESGFANSLDVSMNDQITSTLSDDAMLYRFKLEDVATGEVVIYESSNQKMKLKNALTDPKYNTTYKISVQSTDGIYTTPYGAISEITTEEIPSVHAFDIQLSPNPASNNVNVHISTEKGSGKGNQSNIKIVDTYGIIRIDLNTNANSENINISNLEVGIYSVTVTQGANISTKQLQVMP